LHSHFEFKEAVLMKSTYTDTCLGSKGKTPSLTNQYFSLARLFIFPPDFRIFPRHPPRLSIKVL
jgi:hypothetical protein